MTEDAIKASLLSELVGRLHPYVPGEQPQGERLIKLNTNESPYGPSEAVIDAIRDAADDRLRLYPDPSATGLRQSIADYYDVPIDHVFVGNGSDEVLAFAFAAFFQQPKPLLYPSVSYSFYPVYCNLYDINAETIDLRDDMSLSLDDYDRPNGGIIFPNPNAPTSRAVPISDIEALLKKNTESVVLVDEAYVDFGADSAIPLIKQYPNLVVTQTFSKSRSLAGMRVGLAVAHPALITALESVRDSFNSYPVDTLAQAAATAAMKDTTWFDQSIARVISTRENTATSLVKAGFEVQPSKANFLLVSHPQIPGKTLLDHLRSDGIIVRHWDKPGLSPYIRVSIGTDEDMQAFLQSLQTLVAA